ncbi:MAG: CsbD family protein [Pyrinomonadaceae bacterium]
MGLPNEDEAQGKIDQIKGAIKEKVGRATGDQDMETEGAVDRAGGDVQEGVGTARRKVGEAIEDIGNKISH